MTPLPEDNMVRLVINTPGLTGSYYPEAILDLVLGTWTHIEHSYTNDAGTFALTNLSYSSSDASGTNEVIYLDAADVKKFFKILIAE